MSQVKRILLSKDPFLANKSTLWQEKGFWPASWISHPNKLAKPFVTAYKLDFKLVKDSEFNIHVTADERYELFLDGKRIGRGSERGDADNWFFETYQLNLKKGKHLIVAKVWSLGDKAPMAQMSVEAGFLLAAEAEFEELISTGFANWQVMELKGFDFQIPPATFWRGARLSLDAKQYAWGFENGKGNWQTAKVGKRASNKVIAYVWYKVHRLVAATLPAMLAKKIGDISAKYIDDAKISNSKEVKIDFQNNATDKLDSWQNLLDGKQKITIAANSSQRIILDMNDYYCLFYELSVSKGKNAKVQIHSAESLYTDTKFVEKGHRDQLENKYFNGVGDDFVCDGGNLRRLEPIQYQAGRYWQIQIETQDEELIIDKLKFIETRYPLENQASFYSDNKNLNKLIPLMTRTLQLSSHETLADAPYYEEMMYAGDTRLELLTTYQFSNDNRLARKAIRLFDSSRLANGMIQARYPSWETQVIAPFSIWWIAMLHDYAYWRDAKYIKQFLPGMRATLEGFERFKNKQGLLENVEGWNFLDWVAGWDTGIPPTALEGSNAALNWQLVYGYKLATDLESKIGEPELAQLWQRRAKELSKIITKKFWDNEQGLFADDLAKQHYSEHSQILAILSGFLSKEKEQEAFRALISNKNLSQTSYYFKHYLFEVYRKFGRADLIFEKLKDWDIHFELGLKTTLEEPEPSRSDCHGWASHPLFHAYASILGIRPGSISYKTIEIKPLLANLENVRAKVIHPKGLIEIKIAKFEQVLNAKITLPENTNGQLVLANTVYPLNAGENILENIA